MSPRAVMMSDDMDAARRSKTSKKPGSERKGFSLCGVTTVWFLDMFNVSQQSSAACLLDTPSRVRKEHIRPELYKSAIFFFFDTMDIRPTEKLDAESVSGGVSLLYTCERSCHLLSKTDCTNVYNVQTSCKDIFSCHHIQYIYTQLLASFFVFRG